MVNPNVTWSWDGSYVSDLTSSDLRSDPGGSRWKGLGFLPKLPASESHTDENPVLSVLMNFNIDPTQSNWKQQKKRFTL